MLIKDNHIWHLFLHETSAGTISHLKNNWEHNWLSKTWFFYEVVILWHACSGGCLYWLSGSHDRGEQVSWERREEREGEGGDVKGPFFCNIHTSDLAQLSNLCPAEGWEHSLPPDIHPQHFFPVDDEGLPGVYYKPLSKAGGWNPKRVKVTQQNLHSNLENKHKDSRLPRRYHFSITEDSSEGLTSTLLRSFLAGMSSSLSDFQLAKARGEMRARTSCIWSLLSNIDSLPSADRNRES